MFSRMKKRASAVKFGFSIKICKLSPWPSGEKPCAVGWQRGKSRRGATEKKVPQEVPGQLGTTVEFNEVIHLSATLYMEGGGKASPSGPFKKKCLILAILETDSNTKRTNSLGRVVVDLAEFASVQTEVAREYPVACSKTIQAAVGDPQLVVIVRSSWKGASGPGSFASSLSSDATGGTLTSQLSSLVKSRPHEQAYARGGMTGDQMDELRAFDRLRPIKESESEHRLQATSKTEAEIDSMTGKDAAVAPPQPFDEDGFLVDSDDDRDGEAISPSEQFNGGTSRSESKMTSRISSWLDSSIDNEPGNPQHGAIIGGGQESRDGEKNAREVSKGNNKDKKKDLENGKDVCGRLTHQPQDRKFAHRSQSSGDTAANLENRTAHSSEDGAQALSSPKSNDLGRKTQSPEQGNPPVESVSKAQAPRRWRRAVEGEDETQPQEESTAAVSSPSKKEDFSTFARPHENTEVDMDMQAELRNVAFLEVSVYLVRAGRSQMKSRSIHAPARRIIRTLVALGPEQGCALISDAIKAISAMVDGCGADICGMAYWWSNCVQMRFLLANIGGPGVRNGIPLANGSQGLGEHSTVQEVAERLLQLEKNIFDRVQQYLWWKILVPRVAREGHISKVSVTMRQSADDVENEELARKHQGSARNCDSSMAGSPAVAAGHVPLVSLWKRLRRPYPLLAAASAAILLQTHRLAPFQGVYFRGAITFGEGMRIKMAVTRWAEWAFEMNIKDNHSGSKPGQNLFPQLKAAADFLMMPKELLRDASVRQDVFVALPTRCLCLLLRGFEPDDFAPDPLDPSLLQSLEATLRTNPDAPKAASLSYYPPLLQDLEMPASKTAPAEEMLSFEFDDTSDEELENLGSLFGRKETPSRFSLLKELWLERRNKRKYSR